MGVTRAAALGCLIAARAAAGESALDLVTCGGEAGERVATVEARVVLARAFLDEKLSDDDNARLAILQQLRYLWGWLRTRPPEARAGVPLLVMAAEDPEITITARAAGRYGHDLALDYPVRGPHLAIEDRYTTRAVARGAVHAGDDALIVSYRARFTVAMCSRGGPLPPSLRVPMPDDPWLYYWHLPRARFRLMRYFDESAVCSPCADNDFADLPHPYYLWYDWLPDRHGGDGNGAPFDCRAWLKEGQDFVTRTVALAPAPAASGSLSSLARGLAGTEPLRATFLFGVLDHPVADPKLAEVEQALGPGSLAAVAVAARPRFRERGTRKLLDFLVALPKLLAVRAWRVRLDDGYLRVEVDGALARSGRAITLAAWLGLTDLFGPVEPRHFRILADALRRDQLIVYAGHSGLGENFRLAQIVAHVGIDERAFSAELGRAPYQLIAFLSCYSYMYFGHDLTRAAGRAGRHFVYTGTEFTKGDAGALAVLDLADQALAAPTAAPKLGWIDPSDFLIVKAARPR